jgi:hypothetical protein
VSVANVIVSETDITPSNKSTKRVMRARVCVCVCVCGVWCVVCGVCVCVCARVCVYVVVVVVGGGGDGGTEATHVPLEPVAGVSVAHRSTCVVLTPAPPSC